MKLTPQRIVALCILLHAVFAVLAATWLYIPILLILVSICSFPFWWAVLGYRQMRTQVVGWSLGIGTLIYALPAFHLFQLMLGARS
jgi:sorbitol-specific phosphotransferase system component IIBC